MDTMTQLTRRNFLKSLAGLPALALLKPEVAEADYSPSLGYIEAGQKMREGFLEGLAKGLEASGNDLLKATKPVVEAMKSTLEFGPDGTLYVSGAFLKETPEEYRQRMRDYYSQFQQYT